MHRRTERIEKSSWYFGTPKTDDSLRTVKFGDALCSALKYAQKRQMENQLRYGEYYTDIYLKPEKDEKGDEILRIMESERSVDIFESAAESRLVSQ